MNETTRLYTRDGIKTISYEVYLKLQKHCEELEDRLAVYESKAVLTTGESMEEAKAATNHPDYLTKEGRERISKDLKIMNLVEQLDDEQHESEHLAMRVNIAVTALREILAEVGSSTLAHKIANEALFKLTVRE